MPLASQPLIDAVANASSAEDLLHAVRQLAASSHPQVEPQALCCLVQVLGYNNPGAAVAA
ncbi:MAG: HEAT repeat domain-containing protein, partial [Cyanobium sp.]